MSGVRSDMVDGVKGRGRGGGGRRGQFGFHRCRHRSGGGYKYTVFHVFLSSAFDEEQCPAVVSDKSPTSPQQDRGVIG